MLAAKDKIKFCTDKFELNLFFFYTCSIFHSWYKLELQATASGPQAICLTPSFIHRWCFYSDINAASCYLLLFLLEPSHSDMCDCTCWLCVGQLSLSHSRTRRIQVMLLRLHSAGLSLPLPLPYVAVKPVAPPTWQQLPADHTSLSWVTFNFSNGFLHESKPVCIYWLMY